MASWRRRRRFAGVTASKRGAELFGCPRLHLADDQDPRTAADEVDLTAATAPVPCDDFITVGDIPVGGGVLTLSAECRPAGGRRH